MKLLIKILNSNAQLCEEALSLAFAMVAFEHDVQLWLGEDCFPLLLDKNSKVGKMLSSLEMYDMSPAWLAMDKNVFAVVEKELATFPELQQQLIALPKAIDLAEFDNILTF